MSEYVSEEKIELVANENYWDGAPEIKSLSLIHISISAQISWSLLILSAARERADRVLSVSAQMDVMHMFCLS